MALFIFNQSYLQFRQFPAAVI